VGDKVIRAASAVITDDTNRVLLVKRGREPAKGLWSLPGGSVEEGETLSQAAVREIREETGLHIVTGQEVWRVCVELSEGHYYDVSALSATVTGGELSAGDDAADARWWDKRELSGLDLTPHLVEFLTDYLA